MRACLLLIPFIFSALAHAQDIPAALTETASGKPGQVQPPHLDRLPMDGGWTYGELLDKALTGDFRANMLAGEYWMGFYYLNGATASGRRSICRAFSRKRRRSPGIRHRG